MISLSGSQSSEIHHCFLSQPPFVHDSDPSACFNILIIFFYNEGKQTVSSSPH